MNRFGIPRHVPPAHSPLSLRAVAGGLRGMVGDGARARHAVEGFLRSHWGPEQFVLADSGTSALVLALRLARRLGRLPVAIPAYGCFDIATAVDTAGVPFLFYDLDPRTLAPDPDSLAAAVGHGAASVVVAHLYGVPVDIESVRTALGREVLLIEDAAQGAGVQRHGRPAGAHGDLGVLSFGRGKGLTGGGGGALLLNQAALGQEFRVETDGLPGGGRGAPRTLAALLAQAVLGRPGVYAIPAGMPFLRLGETPYRAPGPVGGLTALSAGVLQWTLGAGRVEAEHRRRNAAALDAALEGAEGIERVTAPGRGWVPGWLRFPVRLAPDLRGRVTGWRRLGIEPGYPGGLDALPGFGVRAVGGAGRWPGAEALAAELVTLPVHSRVTAGDLDRIRRVLRG